MPDPSAVIQVRTLHHNARSWSGTYLGSAETVGKNEVRKPSLPRKLRALVTPMSFRGSREFDTVPACASQPPAVIVIGSTQAEPTTLLPLTITSASPSPNVHASAASMFPSSDADYVSTACDVRPSQDVVRTRSDECFTTFTVRPTSRLRCISRERGFGGGRQGAHRKRSTNGDSLRRSTHRCSTTASSGSSGSPDCNEPDCILARKCIKDITRLQRACNITDYHSIQALDQGLSAARRVVLDCEHRRIIAEVSTMVAMAQRMGNPDLLVVAYDLLRLSGIEPSRASELSGMGLPQHLDMAATLLE